MTTPWRVDPGTFDLSDIDPRSTAGAPGDKGPTKAALADLRLELASYQEHLFAERRRSLLVVLQALDTGGKDSTIRHVFRGVNPMGVPVTSFGPPTDIEKEHDFLWRVHKQVPGAGFIGVFNRSHYEDLVTVKVRGLIPEQVAEQRIPLVRSFEETLVHSGTTVLKFFLHISKKEQYQRLRERADNPDKRWKFHYSDLHDRKLWDEYQLAYQHVIRKTSTTRSPWYVIPADRKWYRNWAVATVICNTLADMDPQVPAVEPFEDLEIK